MGIFDKIKDALFGTLNDVNTFATQNNLSNYIPSYSIENWTPPIKMPKYDDLFSLQNFFIENNYTKNNNLKSYGF